MHKLSDKPEPETGTLNHSELLGFNLKSDEHTQDTGNEDTLTRIGRINNKISEVPL